MRGATRLMLSGLVLVVIVLAGVPQIANGSFEDDPVPASVPSGWNAAGVLDAEVRDIVQGGGDAGMPLDGTRWITFSAEGSVGAVANQGTGSVGALPQNVVGITQSFQLTGAQTHLTVHAAFLSNEQPGTPFNDFLCVSLSDGLTVLNLVFLDTNSPQLGNSQIYGQTLGGAMPFTAVASGAVDIPQAFPTADTNTVFTLQLAVGNGLDGSLHSRGYFDEVTLGAGTPINQGIQPTAIAFVPMAGGATLISCAAGAWPGREIYNLFSMDTAHVEGSGALLGLTPDFVTWHAVAQPMGTHPFHVSLDSACSYQFLVPAGVLAGQTVDALMVVVDGGSVADYSPVARHLF